MYGQLIAQLVQKIQKLQEPRQKKKTKDKKFTLQGLLLNYFIFK